MKDIKVRIMSLVERDLDFVQRRVLPPSRTRLAVPSFLVLYETTNGGKTVQTSGGTGLDLACYYYEGRHERRRKEET